MTSPPPQQAWRSRDVLRVLLLGFAVYYGLQLLWAASSFLLMGFLGLLFGIGLSWVVDRAAWRGIPRALTAVLLVGVVYGALTGMIIWLAPTLREQAGALQQRLPDALDSIDNWLQTRSDGLWGTLLPDTNDPDGAPRLRERLEGALRGTTRFIQPVLSHTVTGVTSALVVTFVALYFAVEPRVYRRGLLHLIPFESRERAREIMRETASVLRRWLVTQFVAMVAVGAITTTLLLVLNVEAAFALGLMVGLLEFIPIAGPIIAAVPTIAMAFLTSPQTALSVTIAFLILQQLESNVLTPLLMKRSLEIPPIMTIAAQGVMTVLFGFVGLIVAVPILAAVLVPVRLLYVRDTVGDEIGE
jgi:predicted PurR-regulated permease PerM